VTEFKLIAGLIALIAVVGLTGWGIVADYDAGKKSGSDVVQKLWDANKAQIQATADAAIANVTKERDAALQANEVAQNGYQVQLSAANASAADFARRLRNAEASIAASSRAMSKVGSGQQSTTTGTQSGDVVLTNALGSALAECSANAAQLNALIAEVKPQQ
jgi:DNA-binding LytR/AlgR family response regulator